MAMWSTGALLGLCPSFHVWFLGLVFLIALVFPCPVGHFMFIRSHCVLAPLFRSFFKTRLPINKFLTRHPLSEQAKREERRGMEGKGARGSRGGDRWGCLSEGRGALVLVYLCVSPGHPKARIQALRASLQPTASWGASGEITRDNACLRVVRIGHGQLLLAEDTHFFLITYDRWFISHRGTS